MNSGALIDTSDQSSIRVFSTAVEAVIDHGAELFAEHNAPVPSEGPQPAPAVARGESSSAGQWPAGGRRTAPPGGVGSTSG
jgi:hypothetical protein